MNPSSFHQTNQDNINYNKMGEKDVWLKRKDVIFLKNVYVVAQKEG